MCRKSLLVQVALWSLLPAGLGFAEDQGSIIDPNGGASRTVKTTRVEDPPPVPDPAPALSGPVVPERTPPALRAAGRDRRVPGFRAAVDPHG